MRQTRNPFRGRLPSLIDGRTVWPRWPVVSVSGRMVRRGDVPPRPYRRVTRVVDASGWKDAFWYAVPGFAQLLQFEAWYRVHRWDLDRWAIDHGIKTGPETAYFHEFKFAPLRKWFRGSGVIPEPYP